MCCACLDKAKLGATWNCAVFEMALFTSQFNVCVVALEKQLS